MKLIGFTGKMGSGKSTAIELIQLGQNKKVVTLKLAAALYDMQEFVYRRVAPVYKRPDNFVKDRKLLQWLGTEWGRDSISQSLWVDLWKESVKAHMGQDIVVICDDVRFDNEAEALINMNGTLLELSRGVPAPEGGPGYAAHPSEAGVSKKYISYTVYNTGTKEQFKQALFASPAFADLRQINQINSK